MGKWTRESKMVKSDEFIGLPIAQPVVFFD
jgi:hypothetical protein